MSSNDEQILKRILAHQTVEGLIIANEEDRYVYTTMDNNLTYLINSKLLAFTRYSEGIVRDLDPTDRLLTCRLRTKTKEMIVITPPDSLKLIALQSLKLPAKHGTTDKN